ILAGAKTEQETIVVLNSDWLNLVKKQSAHRFLRAALICVPCKLISSCFPDLGSDILSINTEEENNFLLTMFQTKWNGPNEILLGMFYDSDDDALKWFDTSELTYKNFREGAQVEMGLLTCAKMNTSTGRWDLVNCETFAQAGTLCKTKARMLCSLVIIDEKKGQRYYQWRTGIGQ
uniref:CD302 molecule n=1 Tax=Leptobrachium leishanense TaxID=445787 RepID=A0A8C5WCP9_9ANUR